MSSRLVSIGVPTFNGERFLAQSLESLLRQDHQEMEIIISDNGSTDRTPEIVADFARRESRIRHERNETNVGALENFDRVRRQASGPYFMWASDHDLWAPSCVSRLAKVLDHDPEVALAYGRTLYMDIDGHPLFVTPDRIDTRTLGPAAGYLRLLWRFKWGNMVYGLHRRAVLDQVAPLENVWSPDMLLLSKLALRGHIVQVDEVLFHRRESHGPEKRKEAKRRVANELDPASAAVRARMSRFALWGELRDAHLRAVSAAPLSLPARMGAAFGTLFCFQVRFGVPFLTPTVIRNLIRTFGESANPEETVNGVKRG